MSKKLFEKEEEKEILDEILETTILVLEAAIEGLLHHENLAFLNQDLEVELRHQKDYLNDMKNEIEEGIEMRVGYVGENYQPIHTDKMEKMWARFERRFKEMFE